MIRSKILQKPPTTDSRGQEVKSSRIQRPYIILGMWRRRKASKLPTTDGKCQEFQKNVPANKMIGPICSIKVMTENIKGKMFQ